MIYFRCFLLFFVSCIIFQEKEDPPGQAAMYFPPNDGSAWDTVSSVSELGWNQNEVQPLLDYLRETNTKSFMILIDGKIVIEKYFNGQNPSDTWNWNSAGKTLISAMVGIAQQEGFLDVHDRVSTYLGQGWSNEPLQKEDLITIRHLLSMASGLDDSHELVIKRNLNFVADADTRWSYSNVFQLLRKVVEKATRQNFDNYFDTEIGEKIGMKGFWRDGVIFTIYHSDARSMARFGLLALNDGMWNVTQLIDKTYFRQSISPSQDINPSYGYLWWLNGKSSYMVPGSQHHFQGFLIPDAPADMYAAMGAQDERIYVIPGKRMVVVRMGSTSDPDHPAFAVSGFDQTLWKKMNDLMNDPSAGSSR